jgi:LPXTG cell wall anchor motif
MAKKKADGKGVEIGLALAGLAAIAGGVFLYGTDAGKKKRKEIKGWTLKAKGEVIEKLEQLKDVNEENYHKVVDAVAAKYKTVKSVAPEELAEVVSDLKKSWKHIVKIAKTHAAPKKKSAAKKAVAKAKPAKK